MRTAINLATRPRVNQRGFWIAGSTLLLLTLVLTVYAVTEGISTWQQRTTTRSRLSQLRTEQSDLRERFDELTGELRDPATQRLLEETQFLNGVIRQKAFSWPVFFVRLGEKLPATMRVLAVTPRLRDDSTVEVQLQLGARDPEAVQELLGGLAGSPHFSRAVLQNQEQNTTGSDLYTAQVRVTYREGE